MQQRRTRLIAQGIAHRIANQPIQVVGLELVRHLAQGQWIADPVETCTTAKHPTEGQRA
ncbi:hypothetical protein D3C86_2228480 [compost metagenome]